MATVRPAPLNPATLYADCRSAGSRPVGLVTVSGAILPLDALWARIRPKQCNWPAFVAVAHPKPTLRRESLLVAASAVGVDARETSTAKIAAMTIAALLRVFIRPPEGEMDLYPERGGRRSPR